MPILAAAFQPVRLVMREGYDHWNLTLDEINSCAYDYVRLNRISAAYDIGILPLSLLVCFDGMLAIPALQRYSDKAEAITAFNAYLAELLMGGLYCEAVTPDNLAVGEAFQNGYTRIFPISSGHSTNAAFRARVGGVGTLELGHYMNPERITVSQLTVHRKSGRASLQAIGPIQREQLLYGCTFYVRNQWGEALIHFWTIVERIIDGMWEKHVIERCAESSRKDFLRDHRTWSMSTKVELFLHKGILPGETCELLSGVRKARNAFVHKGTLPSSASACAAMRICFELCSLSASNLEDRNRFESIISMVEARCFKDIFRPAKSWTEEEATRELACWWRPNPIPGEDGWGDKPYQRIPEVEMVHFEELASVPEDSPKVVEKDCSGEAASD